MAVLLPRAGQADIAWFVDQPAPQPAVPAAPARVRLCNRMAGRWLLRVGGGPPGRGGGREEPFVPLPSKFGRKRGKVLSIYASKFCFMFIY